MVGPSRATFVGGEVVASISTRECESVNLCSYLIMYTHQIALGVCMLSRVGTPLIFPKFNIVNSTPSV